MNNFAVIFDLNGTIIDTEAVHAKAYAEVLAPHGVVMTVEDFTEHWSRQGKKLPDYLEAIGRTDLLAQADDLLEEKQKIFQARVAEQAVLMPGATELLELLKQSEVKMGVESSGDGRNLELMLTHFNLKDFFDVVVSKDTELDEVVYGPKRQKASRLKLTAHLLSFKPSQCIMLGDAEKDIIGAKEAGMKAIAVPNQYTLGQDFYLADNVISGLPLVTVELLQGLYSD